MNNIFWFSIFQKFREYVLNSNRVARLQAKYEHIRVTLGDQTSQPQDGGLTLTRRLNTGKRYNFYQEYNIIIE